MCWCSVESASSGWTDVILLLLLTDRVNMGWGIAATFYDMPIPSLLDQVASYAPGSNPAADYVVIWIGASLVVDIPHCLVHSGYPTLPGL